MLFLFKSYFTLSPYICNQSVDCYFSLSIVANIAKFYRQLIISSIFFKKIKIREHSCFRFLRTSLRCYAKNKPLLPLFVYRKNIKRLKNKQRERNLLDRSLLIAQSAPRCRLPKRQKKLYTNKNLLVLVSQKRLFIDKSVLRLMNRKMKQASSRRMPVCKF